MLNKTITIINKLGLHARAAAKLVSHANRYASDITISYGGRSANGKSIMGVMMLAASKGSEILLTIVGEDAEQALQAIEQLIMSKFGEEE